MSNENVQKSTNRLIKFKTLDNNITEMTVDAEIPIKDLKVLIKDKLNIAPESQRLIVMGKQLNDNKKLSEYVTQDGQVIHLLARVADSTQPPSSQQPQLRSNPQPSPITSSNENRADPFNLNGLLGNYLNTPGMVQLTSLIFDQNGNNITNSAGGSNQNLNANVGNIDLSNILQNLGLNLNTVISNNPSSSNTTNSNITTSNANNTANNNTNDESNSQQQTQPLLNPYPILDDTNRYIGNLNNLNNQLNGNLSNNEIPNVPNLNYPVNILTTFGTTLKNYHNNLQKLLPYINKLSDLLQRESLITDPQDRQNANRLAKNLLTGFRDISGANKMIETFLAGLEFGNRPAGGIVTFIQGSINQIQLVGEALDNMNNPNPISLNINLQNNPSNLNVQTHTTSTNLNSSNNATPTSTLNNNSNITGTIINNAPTTRTTNDNSNSHQNLNQASKSNEKSNKSEKSTEQTDKTQSNPININQQATNNNSSSNENSNRPSGGAGNTGGLNNLLGSLMGGLGNTSSSGTQVSGRQANPLGNIGSLVNNIMSNPETSSMMNNMISSLSRPGGQNNLASMFGGLMGSLNSGNNQGSQPNLGNLLSSLMGNMGENNDEEEEEFEINPEIKKLCDNKNIWKKTKLYDLKNSLNMIENPQFSELVEILLDFTIDEFYLLKRLQLDGFARQADKIRERLKAYMKKNNIDLVKLKQILVEILNENFILVENDDNKIITEGFDLDKFSDPFISDLIEYFLKMNSNETELNDMVSKRLIDFIGNVYNELKNIYSTEREGALYFFADNLKDFIEKNFGDDSIDNLLEINENVFEEMVSNGIDIFEEIKKNENKKKTMDQSDKKQNNNPIEIQDMNHILSIASQDEKRFEKKNINFSDEYIKTSLFKD